MASQNYNFDEILAEYRSGMEAMKFGNDSSFFMAAKRGPKANTTAVSPHATPN
jgi:hypothetical protein